jgi:hypothetical protein
VCRVSARCPVTALAWAAAPAGEDGHPAALVLAAGCADGSVALFGTATPPQLGGNLLRPLGQIVQPDMRSVLSLTAACEPSSHGGTCWDQRHGTSNIELWSLTQPYSGHE